MNSKNLHVAFGFAPGTSQIAQDHFGPVACSRREKREVLEAGLQDELNAQTSVSEITWTTNRACNGPVSITSLENSLMERSINAGEVPFLS